jgi:hypothetical protein
LFIRSLNQAAPLAIFLSFILLNLALGLVVAIDGWYFERRLGAAGENRPEAHIGWRQAFISGTAVAFWLCSTICRWFNR